MGSVRGANEEEPPMTDKEKIEWAKRAFAEIAEQCEGIAALDIVSAMECRTWISMAATARRNIEILEQPYV